MIKKLIIILIIILTIILILIIPATITFSSQSTTAAVVSSQVSGGSTARNESGTSGGNQSSKQQQVHKQQHQQYKHQQEPSSSRKSGPQRLPASNNRRRRKQQDVTQTAPQTTPTAPTTTTTTTTAPTPIANKQRPPINIQIQLDGKNFVLNNRCSMNRLYVKLNTSTGRFQIGSKPQKRALSDAYRADRKDSAKLKLLSMVITIEPQTKSSSSSPGANQQVFDEVRLRSNLTGRYICFDEHGHLVARVSSLR